jgi:hypothetical protein
MTLATTAAAKNPLSFQLRRRKDFDKIFPAPIDLAMKIMSNWQFLHREEMLKISSELLFCMAAVAEYYSDHKSIQESFYAFSAMIRVYDFWWTQRAVVITDVLYFSLIAKTLRALAIHPDLSEQ